MRAATRECDRPDARCAGAHREPAPKREMRWPRADRDTVRRDGRRRHDPDIRAIVLTGADPAFCAGVDLKEAQQLGTTYFARFQTHNCINKPAEMATPILAAISRATFTGGPRMALACDFMIASERAVFADTHAWVGILPGGGMTVRLPQRRAPMARRLSMTGEVVDAARAERIGLVTEVVLHDERLLPRAIQLAEQIAEVPAATRPASGRWRPRHRWCHGYRAGRRARSPARTDRTSPPCRPQGRGDRPQSRVSYRHFRNSPGGARADAVLRARQGHLRSQRGSPRAVGAPHAGRPGGRGLLACAVEEKVSDDELVPA